MMRFPLCVFLAFAVATTAFQPVHPLTSAQRKINTERHFFRNLLDAFENDSLSQNDKLEGMIEGPNNEAEEANRVQVTAVQQAWRQQQKSGVPSEMLENTSYKLEVYLAGVPSKDPSNDLYGSRVNISSRDKESNLDLPDDPTIALKIKFLPNGVCTCDASDFTTGKEGEWKLSPDGEQLRFSLDVLGYSRTVQTTGSIQKVFWSQEPTQNFATQSDYNIPAGWVYADVIIGYGRPGTIDFKTDGLLRIERQMGLLGAASKLVNCGKFEATQVFSTGPGQL